MKVSLLRKLVKTKEFKKTKEDFNPFYIEAETLDKIHDYDNNVEPE